MPPIVVTKDANESLVSEEDLSVTVDVVVGGVRSIGIGDVLPGNEAVISRPTPSFVTDIRIVIVDPGVIGAIVLVTT